MLRIAIVDDDVNEMKIISTRIDTALHNHKITYHLNLYEKAAELLKEQKKSPFDVVFLDIDMPDINGMDVAEQLHHDFRDTEIIFVTHHSELVYQTFRFKALGFIRKQHMEEEIDEVISVIQNEWNQKNKFLILKDGGNDIPVRLDDVMYMQSDEHYVDVFTVHGKITIRGSLNSIENNYGNLGLIRIHARYLVYYKFIYSIEKNHVVLQNRQQIPISRNRSAMAKQQFQLFSRRV